MENLEQDKKKSSVSVWALCLVSFSFFVFQHLARRQGEPLQDIFLTVINKSVSFTAFTMFSAALLTGFFIKLWPASWSAKRDYLKSFGVLGLILSIAHVLISVMMFSASYYPAYFTPENKMTAVFGASLLFGTAALVFFIARGSALLSSVIQKPGTVNTLNYIMYAFLLIHIFILKYRELFDSGSWKYGWPSGHFVGFLITIIVAVFAVITVFRGKKG